MNLTTGQIGTRPLSPGDLEAVIAIDAKTSGTLRRGYFEKRLAAAVEHPRDYVFVGTHLDDRLAGFAFAKLETGAFGQHDATAALDTIAVDPDLELRGVGRALLTEVEAVLRRKGVGLLTSEVEWSSTGLLGFMAHQGFAMAPRIVLTRPVGEIAIALDEPGEDDDAREIDFSSPEGDAANALSREPVPVRSMEERDLRRIVAMDRASTGTDRTDYYARRMREALEQSGIRVSLVAEADGDPVGFIMARVDYGAFGLTRPEAVMDAIGVDPGYRGRNIGTILMARLMGNLGALEIATVRTEIAWDDTALISFLGALDFAPAQRIVLEKRL